MKPIIFKSAKKITPTQIRQLLEPDYHITNAETSTRHEEYYDTFDLALHAKRLILLMRENVFYLFSEKNHNDISRQKIENGVLPRFWWDLSEKKLQEYVKPIIGLRAIMHLGTLEEKCASFFIQNGEKKNIGRIVIHNRSLNLPGQKRQNLPSLAIISPLKGFNGVFGTIRDLLIENFQEATPAAVYHNILKQAGYIERINRAQYPPQLKSSWSVCHTIKTIAEHLSEELEVQRQGIIDDIDTEFLHDFRVALRRFRAIIGQLKNEMLPAVYESVQEGLKAVSSTTGALRDLDVLLLEEKYYASMVPAPLKNGLDLFFTFIRVKRGKAHDRLSAYLVSSDYYETLKQIGAIFKQPGEKICMPIVKSISKLAADTIKNRYIKLRQKIDRFADDHEVIHQIRIDCKKARYLLELFSQLFSGKGMKKSIKDLKQFQTRLGDLRDVQIQQELLLQSIRTMEESAGKSPEATAAVGGLITILAEKGNILTAKSEAALIDYRQKIGNKTISKLFTFGK